MAQNNETIEDKPKTWICCKCDKKFNDEHFKALIDGKPCCNGCYSLIDYKDNPLRTYLELTRPIEIKETWIQKCVIESCKYKCEMDDDTIDENERKHNIEPKEKFIEISGTFVVIDPYHNGKTEITLLGCPKCKNITFEK